MFPTSVIRKLARSEEMFAQSQTFFGFTAELSGPVDVEAMSTAFDTLLWTYPVLGGRLERRPDGLHDIVSDDLVHPGIWVVYEKTNPTRTARMRLDQSVSVANLRLELGDGLSRLTFYTHHSLTDAQHQFHLLGELFSFYTDAVSTGNPPVVSAHPAPKPLEVLLDERGVGKKSRSGLERLMSAMFAYDLPPSPRNTAGGNPVLPALVPAARCRLTNDETQNLASFCRDKSLSLNAVIGAAILMAEWQSRNTPNIPIPYLYPVDLRLLLTPPVDATDSTNPLGVAAYLAKIGPSTEIEDLASDIVATFRGDLADGVIQQSLLHFDLQYAGNPPGLPDVVIATDGGSVPGMRLPANLRLEGVETELHTASTAGVDLYGSFTFGDCLHIEHHAHAPAPQGTVESIRTLLCSVPAEDEWMAE